MQKLKLVFFVVLVLLAVNISLPAMAEKSIPANHGGDSVSLLNSVNPTNLSKAAADLVKEENLIKQGKIIQTAPPRSDVDEYVEAFHLVWDKGKVYIIIFVVLVVALLISMSRPARF